MNYPIFSTKYNSHQGTFFKEIILRTGCAQDCVHVWYVDGLYPWEINLPPMFVKIYYTVPYELSWTHLDFVMLLQYGGELNIITKKKKSKSF